MTQEMLDKIASEYEGLSRKIDSLSKTRDEREARQMQRANAEMIGMKKALLCMGYDIGKTRSGKYAIQRITKIRR